MWFGFCPQPCTEPLLTRSRASHILKPLQSSFPVALHLTTAFGLLCPCLLLEFSPLVALATAPRFSAPHPLQALSRTFLTHISWDPMGPFCDPACSPWETSDTDLALMPTVTRVYPVRTCLYSAAGIRNLKNSGVIKFKALLSYVRGCPELGIWGLKGRLHGAVREGGSLCLSIQPRLAHSCPCHTAFAKGLPPLPRPPTKHSLCLLSRRRRRAKGKRPAL